MNQATKFAGVILNGGLSSRMGQDKSKLKLNDVTLLQRTQNLFNHSGIKEVLISGNDGIKDQYTNKGPLAGIHASLIHLKHCDFIIFMPVDMPLITTSIIEELKQFTSSQASHFSCFNLPLIISNTQTTRTIIDQHIKNNNLSIKQLLLSLHTHKIENTHPKQCFINTNCPEQWQQAQIFHKNGKI